MAAFPAIFSIYYLKSKYILWFAIMITVHNVYWMISFFAYQNYFSSMILIPVLIVSLPLNVMIFVLYKKIRNPVNLGEEGDVILTDIQPNYNSNQVININNDVYEWLNDIGLSRYHDLFIQNGIEDVQTILTLTKDDLDRIGVKLGHRNKIMGKIQNNDDNNRGGVTNFY